jgi:hypothetical protein
MTERRSLSEDAPGAAAPPLLAEVEALLARQLEHVQRGQVDAAYQVGRQMADLTAKIRATGLAPDSATAARLRRLYDTLALALTQQMVEVSEKRSRLRRQSKTTRAYRSANTVRGA